MNATENLKKQLAGLAEAVNSFSSEAVQLIVIDRVLKQLQAAAGQEQNEGPRAVSTEAPVLTAKQPGKNGATKILQELLQTGYFDKPRSIGELTEFCQATYTGPFYTNQMSGLLLGLVSKNKLERSVSPDTNRFVYRKSRADYSRNEL